MRPLLLLMALLFNSVEAAYLHFDTYKKQGEQPGDTLFVIGGIHGNEPGSYFAAGILARHYEIQKGALWVIPNLNFDSIVRNRRGIYGDMNRKFDLVDKKDSDYEIVQEVKELMLTPEVDIILNLHDGRGFYRHKWENSIFNPGAWGQACIIDQKCIHDQKYSNLDEIGQNVSEKLNADLEHNHHQFNVKNTETEYKDEQMQLSLTYFAVRNKKSAFAIETSKNIEQLHQKVYYHLKAIEAYMDLMGIEFTRDFELNKSVLKDMVSDFGSLTLNDSIVFDLDTISSRLRYIPIKNRFNTFTAENPLAAIYRYNKGYRISVGNKTISTVRPEYMKIDSSLKHIKIEVDGEVRNVTLPSSVAVKERFKVMAPEGYRVNIIGYQKKGSSNENNLEVPRKAIMKRFSMDKRGEVYRVEIYKGKAFSGMINVTFVE
ncbi:MAG: hypothetical protein DRP93_08220 [Candidatus Neomarinimicrobiota bacterium]|nr:MAG: hypothetical protein DRP93_08220 [Candidatus Neomarinimicrobiota bacterium]